MTGPEFVTEVCAACLGKDPACDTCDGRGTVRRRVRPARPSKRSGPPRMPRGRTYEGFANFIEMPFPRAARPLPDVLAVPKLRRDLKTAARLIRTLAQEIESTATTSIGGEPLKYHPTERRAFALANRARRFAERITRS